MIHESADFFENIARQFGLAIKIPRPCKTVQNACVITNALVGFGLVAAGVKFRKMPLMLLGVLGIAGASLLAMDK